VAQLSLDIVRDPNVSNATLRLDHSDDRAVRGNVFDEAARCAFRREPANISERIASGQQVTMRVPFEAGEAN